MTKADTTTTSPQDLDRVGELERRYVEEVLASEFRTSSGSLMTSRLEAAFAEFVGVPFAISFINGTATLHAGLVAAGVGPGDEVIVPPLTMASTTLAVLEAGATPVFADVDRDTFVIDAESVRGRMTERTRAIIPVALYGVAPDLDELVETVGGDVVILEDDAQALGTRYRGRVLGSVGTMASFSFQSSKQLTSGEGGMLVTADEGLATAVRRVGSLGYAAVGSRKGKITKDDIQDPGYARHVSSGFNYRMPELCAAVALAQLERREELVGRRVAVGELFRAAVAGREWLRPQEPPAGSTHTYWAFAAVIDHPEVGWHGFRDRFLANGGDPYYGAWRLTYQEPLFADGRMHADCANAEWLQPRLIQLKTNYWRWAEAERQAEALARTAEELG